MPWLRFSTITLIAVAGLSSATYTVWALPPPECHQVFDSATKEEHLTLRSLHEKLGDQVVEDFRREADDVVRDIQEGGAPLSPDEERLIRSVLTLRPLLEQGSFYLAVALEKYEAGFDTEAKMALDLKGFRSLSFEEREQITENVLQKLKRVTGAGLKRSDIHQLEQLAASAGLSVDLFVKYGRETRQLFERASPLEIKFAIFSLMDIPSDNFVQNVTEQLRRNPKAFQRTRTEKSANALPVVVGDRIPQKIPTAIPFQRRTVWVRRELVEAITKCGFAGNPPRVIYYSSDWNVDNTYYNYPKDYFNFDDFCYLRARYKRAYWYGDNDEIQAYWLKSGFASVTHEQAQLLLKVSRNRANLLEALRKRYPDDPYYQNLLLGKVPK